MEILPPICHNSYSPLHSINATHVDYCFCAIFSIVYNALLCTNSVDLEFKEQGTFSEETPCLFITLSRTTCTSFLESEDNK